MTIQQGNQSNHTHTQSRNQQPWKSYYDTLPIPAKLLDDHHTNPIDIGIYVLIARQYLIRKMTVPLSQNDIPKFDPSLSRGTVIRSLNRLKKGGWIILSPHRGKKTHYMPTWGYLPHSVSPTLWDITAPKLGRHASTRTKRIPKALLDDQMGRIAPNPDHPAHITRHTGEPLATLTEIGNQILNNTPVPITNAPQHADGSSPKITRDASSIAAADTSTIPPTIPPTLRGFFFALWLMIGSMIGGLIANMIAKMIAWSDYWQQTQKPVVSAKSVDQATTESSDGNPGKSDKKTKENPPTHPAAGSGEEFSLPEKAVASQPDSPTAVTETTRLLYSLGVSYAAARELADVPLEWVQQVVVQARWNPNVRSIPGWTVALLRQKREEAAVFATEVPPTQPVASPTEELPTQPVASPTEELPTQPVAFPTEELPTQPVAIPTRESPEQSAAASVAADTRESLAEEESVSPLQQARAAGDLAQGWELATQKLQYRVFRTDFDALRGIQLLVWNDTNAVIGCISIQQKMLIEDRLMSALRQSLEVPFVQCYLVHRK